MVPEQADVHRRDLAAGRDRVELDPGEAQPIVQIGNVGELAAEAVEGLDHDDVEATERHVRQQLLVARPKAAGAAHRAILVGAGQRPALLDDEAAGNLDLIPDRVLALEIRRKAGVDNGAHGLTPSSDDADRQ
jgi:hypothetical protein